MNLTWHIVKKDLRALKWPLLVWVLILVAKLGIGVLLLSAAGTDGRLWFLQMAVTAKVLTAFEYLSFVLTAAIIQQDLLVGTTAFWMTRPISGGRLLCAKLWGIGLVFGLMPVLVSLPWWLGCGYGLREVLWAATETVAAQAIAVLLGLLCSVVTDGFARFLMWTLVTLFATPTLTGIVTYSVLRHDTVVTQNLAASRLVLSIALAVLGIGAVVVHQFLTRRTGRSIGLIASTIGLIVLTAAFWPWAAPVQSRLDSFLVRQARGEWPVAAKPTNLVFTLESAEFRPQRVGKLINPRGRLWTKYRIEGLDETQGIIAVGSEHSWLWADGHKDSGTTWSDSDLKNNLPRRALGLPMQANDSGQYSSVVATSASVPQEVADLSVAELPTYVLQARLRLMRLDSVAPVPLQAGSRRLMGTWGERVGAVGKDGEKLLVTFIQTGPSLWVDNAGGGQPAPFASLVQYYLVNRAQEFVDRGSLEGKLTTRIGTVGISWNTMAYRASRKGGGARPLLEAMQALDTAEFVRVSYTEQTRFTHEMKVVPFNLALPQP